MRHMPGDVKRQYRSQARAVAAEETRRRIREAAIELFASQGYLGTTLREVARRAGVGERTLYDSFGSKFRLWRHIVNMLTMGDDQRVPAADRPDAVAARQLDDPREAVAAHCAIGAALMERAGDMIMVGEAAAVADPELGRSMAVSLEATYRVHLLLAQRLEDRGDLRAGLDAQAAADILATIGSPYVFHALRRQRGWSAARYQEWLTATLTQQLIEPPEGMSRGANRPPPAFGAPPNLAAAGSKAGSVTIIERMATDGFLSSFDGVPIAYRDYGGDGDGLILLHGIGGNLESMHGLATRLMAERRVVTTDVRFCGQSGDAEAFRFADTVRDVEQLAAELDLRNVAVCGASMGGIIAGYFGARHPDRPVISIDGFEAGSLPAASTQEADEYEAWASATREGLEAMTAAPETGDRMWMEDQVQRHLHLQAAMDYRSERPELEARRNLVALGGDHYRRHPSRRLLDDQLADLSQSMIHTFRQCHGPILIIYCTQAGWPSALARELDGLARDLPNLRLEHLDASHTAPVWKEADRTTDLIRHFLRTQ